MTTQAQEGRTIATRAKFNNCHVLTVSQNWHDNGKPFWQLLAGTACNEGFEMAQRPTRAQAIALALDVVASSDYGFILAWQNGHRAFHWIDVPHYRRTKQRRAT